MGTISLDEFGKNIGIKSDNMIGLYVGAGMSLDTDRMRKYVEENDMKFYWATDESSRYHGLYNGDMYILYKDFQKLPKDYKYDAVMNAMYPDNTYVFSAKQKKAVDLWDRNPLGIEYGGEKEDFPWRGINDEGILDVMIEDYDPKAKRGSDQEDVEYMAELEESEPKPRTIVSCGVSKDVSDDSLDDELDPFEASFDDPYDI